MQLTATAYTDSTRGERSPTLIHHSEAGETLLVCADATDGPFSHFYQPLIDLVKSSFLDSLARDDAPMQEQMKRAAYAIETVMRDRFPSSHEFVGEYYSTVFAAVGVDEWGAWPLWVGSPQAILVRNKKCIRSTTPDVTAIPNGGLIVTNKSITADSSSGEFVSCDEPWPLAEKDLLLVADCRLVALFADNELADIIAKSGINKARSVVEAAQAMEFSFSRSAIVAEVV